MPFQPIAEIRRSSPDEMVEFVSERFRRPHALQPARSRPAPFTEA